MTKPTPSSRARSWWKRAAIGLGAVLVLLAILPWLLGTSPLRSQVAAALNRKMAPGRVEFASLELSWFGPTRLARVVVLDPRGVAVIQAPIAILDQTLGQLILGVRGPAVVRLDGASLDVERRADGSLDLVDAIHSLVATPDPYRDVTIQVTGGSIRYRDPFLAEPAVAAAVDLTIHAPYAPGPVSWSVKFAQGDSSLESQGDFDAWRARGGPSLPPELTIGVVGKRFPLVTKVQGVNASGRLDGSLDFVRKRGLWVFSGDARLLGLGAQGESLLGDRLSFDQLEAGWDVAQGGTGWSIRRLSLVSPLARLKAEGLLDGPDGVGKQRIEGTVDLAEVARQLPHALRLRDGLTVQRGTARVEVDLESRPGRSTYEVEARVADLAALDHDRPLALQDPATFHARLIRLEGQTTVEQLAVKTSFLDLHASGKPEEGIPYEGTINLGGLRKQVGAWFDLGGLELAGQAQVSGDYRTDSGRRFVDRLSLAIQDLRVEGVGPSIARRDRVTFDLEVSGPSLATGWPDGWDRMKASLGSGESSARLDLAAQPNGTRMTASAQVPLGSTVKAGGLTALVVDGTWAPGGQVLAIDRASVSSSSTDPKAARPKPLVVASGQLDLARGELSLNAPAGLGDPLVVLPAEDGLRVSGLGQNLELLRVDGGLVGSLETIDRFLAAQTGREPLGWTGRWSGIGSARGDGDGVQVTGKLSVDVDGQIPPGSAGKPARSPSLAVRARYSPKLDRLDLAEFTVLTPYGSLDASGRLDRASTDRQVDLKGTLAPDFEVINALLASRVEPGARVVGKPRRFHASGPIGGDGPVGWQGLDAELGFDLLGADIYGMKFGPSPVVLRARRGRLAFDPISTSLNEGHIRLEPEVDLEAPGGPVLRLAKNSAIREARINDEVSKRVLAFVAPILDQATRARGLVSVDLDHAEFPLGSGRGRQAKVEGAVVFENVEFAPGPLAAEILGAIGRRDASLKLDQPINLAIADGRVNQRGMSIPIADFTRIELEGWVDFDRNLALRATVPVTPAMLGNNPLLADIAAGTRVKLPIGGTLDNPRIDGEAFTANLGELGKSLLTRGATRGAMELLMRLGRPKDPDAPPPPPRPSPEERKAQRQEKKAIRRGEIPPPQ